VRFDSFRTLPARDDFEPSFAVERDRLRGWYCYR
jgi:hypothetical protein